MNPGGRSGRPRPVPGRAHPGRFIWTVSLGLSVSALCAAPGLVRADGWHNAALATASLDEWMADVKAAVPEIGDRLTEGQLKSGRGVEDLKKRNAQKPKSSSKPSKPTKGGKLENLTPQQRELLGRKANDCLETLAYMDEKNIFPAEFPQFQLNKIPEYRQAAKALLKMMGPTGASAIAAQVRAELMGMGYGGGFDVTPSPSYHAELVKLLQEAAAQGDLSAADINSLLEAAQGQKPPPYNQFAKEVTKVLNGDGADLGTLVDLMENTEDAKRKLMFERAFKKQLSQATFGELMDVDASQASASAQKTVNEQLKKRLSEASLAELFRLAETTQDAALRKSAAGELAARSPKYGEVKDQLAEIAGKLGSSNKSLASAAKAQVANAFQRAPIGECLDWLGKADKTLRELIWEQVDDRLKRADTDRRAAYQEAALAKLRDRSAADGARRAAADLLGRIKDVKGAGEVVSALAEVSRDLRPDVAKALKEITGQDFGPKAGDGFAELSVALNKWRAWLKENGG